ncbi:MAG: hypothetical protein IPL59_22370 [Candidatus Competibacteraceae bacterium]|nr:hypothetical protein [Candidatus Competibacteraceae bacterium]
MGEGAARAKGVEAMACEPLTHGLNSNPTRFKKRGSGSACGFAYNWALAEWQRQFRRAKPNEAAARQFNAIKPMEFPWILDRPKRFRSRPSRTSVAPISAFPEEIQAAFQAARRPRLGAAGQWSRHLHL